MLRFIIFVTSGLAGIAVSIPHGGAKGHVHQGVLHSGRTDLMTSTNRTRGGKDAQPDFRTPADLTCLRNTLGTCIMSDCKSERGPTVCEKGRCLCAPGYCANTNGVCSQDNKVKWLGEFSIQFTNPYHREASYVASSTGTVFGPGTYYSVPTLSLAATGDSQPKWKVAMTTTNRIRLESLEQPGFAMHMFNNRRRANFFLQAETKSKESQAKSAANYTGAIAEKSHSEKEVSQIPDDDDIRPAISPIEDLAPIEVDFQVRPTHKNGGGYEIWHPLTRHVLASGNPDWNIKDRVAANGIAECFDDDSYFGGDCEGRQLIKFDPDLPFEATPFVSKADFSTADMVNPLHWWQSLPLTIFACCFLVCWCACFCGMISSFVGHSD